MNLYPMTLLVSDDATDVTVEGLAYETGLNVNSIRMLLNGATIHVADDFLDTIKRVNERYAGKLTLLAGKPINLGDNDEVNLDMNTL